MKIFLSVYGKILSLPPPLPANYLPITHQSRDVLNFHLGFCELPHLNSAQSLWIRPIVRLMCHRKSKLIGNRGILKRILIAPQLCNRNRFSLKFLSLNSIRHFHPQILALLRRPAPKHIVNTMFFLHRCFWHKSHKFWLLPFFTILLWQ